MDINKAKPIGTRCIACYGQTNVLMAGWTIDGEPEVQHWTCPRCSALNTIMVQGKVIGVAYATVRLVSGTPQELCSKRSTRGNGAPASDGDGGAGGAKPPG